MGFRDDLTVCQMLAECTDLPLLADADTGYGNAVNVHFTVRGGFEDSGLAGVMLEDQAWPKRCGHLSGKQATSAEEDADKIRAAAEAGRDPDFVIKARTDALATHGISEAIRRINMYGEAGADLLFVDALMSEDDASTVARN
jgi:2-methylisocitrate lyase-like PEP mutase family enzyme